MKWADFEKQLNRLCNIEQLAIPRQYFVSERVLGAYLDLREECDALYQAAPWYRKLIIKWKMWRIKPAKTR